MMRHHRCFCSFLLWFLFAFVTVTEKANASDSSGDEVEGTSDKADALVSSDDEAVIAHHVDSIIELKAAGLDFYTKAAKRVGKMTGAGCILGALSGALVGGLTAGPAGALYAAATPCLGGGIMFGIMAAIDAPLKHWSDSAKAAYRARKAYMMSFVWLNIDGFDVVGADQAKAAGIVSKAFRKCAMRYHPDKLPKTATDIHRQHAETKLANCKFGKAYLLAFQKRYGVLDPEDRGPGARKFLETFAGAWAAAFGANDGDGSLSLEQVEEWLSAVKHHTEMLGAEL